MTPRLADLRGLRLLADRLGDRFAFGCLLSAAPEATPLGRRLAALPGQRPVDRAAVVAELGG